MLEVLQQIQDFVVQYLGVHIRNYYNEAEQAKSLILTLQSFINVPGIRQIAAHQLQSANWIQNPTLCKSAKQLLHDLARHCTTNTEEDRTAVDSVLRIKWRASFVSLFTETLGLLVAANKQNMQRVLEQCIHNEMNMAHSNFKTVQLLWNQVDDNVFSTQHLAHALRRVSIDERGRNAIKPLLRKLLKLLGDRLHACQLAVSLIPDASDLIQQQQLQPQQQLRWHSFMLELVLLAVQLRASSLLLLPEQLAAFFVSLSELQMGVVTWLGQLVNSQCVDEGTRVHFVKMLHKGLFLEPLRE